MINQHLWWPSSEVHFVFPLQLVGSAEECCSIGWLCLWNTVPPRWIAAGLVPGVLWDGTCSGEENLKSVNRIKHYGGSWSFVLQCICHEGQRCSCRNELKLRIMLKERWKMKAEIWNKFGVMFQMLVCPFQRGCSHIWMINWAQSFHDDDNIKRQNNE